MEKNRQNDLWQWFYAADTEWIGRKKVEEAVAIDIDGTRNQNDYNGAWMSNTPHCACVRRLIVAAERSKHTHTQSFALTQPRMLHTHGRATNDGDDNNKPRKKSATINVERQTGMAYTKSTVALLLAPPCICACIRRQQHRKKPNNSERPNASVRKLKQIFMLLPLLLSLCVSSTVRTCVCVFELIFL